MSHCKSRKMIELDALKEQLRLLGHDLPDEQIMGILRDMNIDLVGNRGCKLK